MLFTAPIGRGGQRTCQRLSGNPAGRPPPAGCGQPERGKSTLINALLGRAVLPAGVTPLTAVATTVRYGDDPHAGQTELLAGAIRRALPGELGRRAREHLRREALNLVEAQIGRARGDLQYRLTEAGRAMARETEQRYADATGRMRAALQAAEEMRSSSAAAAQEKERELSEREVAAQHVLTLLGEAAGPGG